jgi:protein PhnA
MSASLGLFSHRKISMTSLETTLRQRANSKCELCSSTTGLSAYLVKPFAGPEVDASVLVCEKCHALIPSPAQDPKHWFGLKESMWSDVPAVQVLTNRILKNMNDDPWAQDLLGQMYLDENLQKWADAGSGSSDENSSVVIVDSNGTRLAEGDSVTLIKDLVVKGANFTAKRGTVVKNINLTDDPQFIEGKVNGTRIVLVAAYLKKV